MRLRNAPLVRAEVYGDDEPAVDDPAELFHEASKLYPALSRRQGAGIVRLEASDALRAAAAHPVRRNPLLRSHPLPPPRRPRCSLWTALDRRSSRRDFRAGLRRAELGTLLDAGYGGRGERRTVPSAGALYPLELHVAIRSDGVYRYDPEQHALEEHERCDPWPAIVEACPVPGIVDDGTSAVLVLAVFGRTRFKYGQRGVRFALLEAGHAVQNVVLAAAALDVPALPLGGFYDARLDELVGADGVEESVVYAVIV